MQAIETEYRWPTNTRGSRIIARAQAGRISVPYDHARSFDENHDAAMRAFVEKWGWFGTWIRGARADGKGNVYVCAKHETRVGYRTPHPQAVDPLGLVLVRVTP